MQGSVRSIPDHQYKKVMAEKNILKKDKKRANKPQRHFPSWKIMFLRRAFKVRGKRFLRWTRGTRK